MYLLSCPNCQTELKVTPAQAGDSIQCRQCGGSVAIPKLGELRQLRQIDEPNSRGEPTPSRSAAATAVFVVASLLTVAALLVAGYNAVRWAMIETDVTTETHLESITRNYAAAQPGSMVVEFEQMEQNSLDLIAPYTYQTKVNEKNSWGRNALIAGGLAILFAGLAIFSAIRGRSETVSGQTQI